MRPSSLGGGHIFRRTLSVCLSFRLSVRPVIVAMVTSFRQPLASRMYCPASVTSRHLANYNDTDVLFARTEGRISYGHLGRTNSCSFCFSFTCVDSVCCWILINLIWVWEFVGDGQVCRLGATVAWVVECGLWTVKLLRPPVLTPVPTSPFCPPVLQSTASSSSTTTTTMTLLTVTMSTWRYGMPII